MELNLPDNTGWKKVQGVLEEEITKITQFHCFTHENVDTASRSRKFRLRNEKDDIRIYPKREIYYKKSQIKISG